MIRRLNTFAAGSAVASPGLALVVALGLGMVSPAAAQDLGNGQTLYEDDCADCHGLTGKGDGLFAQEFDLDVRDFTTGPLEFDTNGDCATGTAADFFDVTRQGAEAFGGDENMEPRSVEDISDADLGDVIAYIQDEFTSQIVPIDCLLCGRDVVVGGKGVLKIEGKGKTKDKLKWDIDLQESGTWTALDGEDAFDGCWRSVGTSGRKYQLELSDAALMTLLDHLTAVGQEKITGKLTELTATKDPETLLKANKSVSAASLEMVVKADATVKGKTKAAKYKVDVKSDLPPVEF